MENPEQILSLIPAFGWEQSKFTEERAVSENEFEETETQDM